MSLINDIQHELTSLRQTVDAWNQDDQHEGHEEDRQEEIQLGDNPDLPLKEGHDLIEQDPPGLMRSASMAGSATTIIVSALELPLLQKRETGEFSFVMLTYL